ncbi:MAG: recombinase family protein [candidate division Zixibacteria bacterium]|nr:recombinase family protein [candidate division Zixibacteria bacterium]
MRCAIYARYSDESQNPKSTTDQISQCREYITSRGWTVGPSQIYSDDAVSGSVLNRAAYIHMKAAALTGAFAYIVVDDLSRLGRNAAECLHVYQEFTTAGVNIAAIADGIDSAVESSKLPYYFKSITNEIFLDDLKAKIVRGLKGQVLRGYSAGGRVYGYDTKPDWIEPEQYDKFGRRRRHGVRVVINPREAAVVLRIFQLFAQGIGYRHIASTLNAEQIESPHSGCGHRSGYWQSSTIRAMLKQPKYVGDWTWNRTKWNKKNATGKRLARLNPASAWVHHRCEDLRIVPPSLWQQVQNRLSQSSARTSPGNRKSFALSGLLTCANCGSKLVIVKSRGVQTYACNRHRSGGPFACSSTARLPRREAEQSIFAELKSLLLNQESLSRIASHVREFLRRSEKPTPASTPSLKRRERQLSAALQRLLEAIEDGQGSQLIVERIRQREAELFEIREQITASTGRAAGASSHPAADPDSDTTTTQIAKYIFQLETLIDESISGNSRLLTEFNALLKRLIPVPLRVEPQYDRNSRTRSAAAFTITGHLSPLNLLQPGLISPAYPKMNSGAGT